MERLYRHRFEFCNVKPTRSTFCNFKCNFEIITRKQKAHIALSREIWILTALWADVWQITISLSTVWRKQLFNIFQQLHGLVLEGKQGIPETTYELHGHNATVSSGPEECAFRQNGRSKSWFYVPLTKAHKTISPPPLQVNSSKRTWTFMFRKAELWEKTLIKFGAVKCTRFTSTSYIPQGCQGMSKVNKMYFHWTSQTQLSLLLASLSCCDMETLFQCNLHILVDGFVSKSCCTVDILSVH